MKVNDFNPVRLKSARLYRGKIIDVLAKETDVQKKDILAFEESKYLPKLENAQKLANALNFPIEYFYRKDKMKVLVENVHFAVPGSIPRVEEVAFREKLVMTHKIVTFIEENVSIPDLNLPTRLDRNLDMEKLSVELRKYWNIGDAPIQNLGKIMEENGIIISTMNSGKKGLAPFTQKQSINSKLRYLVCLGDDKGSQPRRNFDLAYELGYIIGDALKIPTKRFSKDEFACALLLPKESFFEDLENPNDLDSYVNLKKKYNTPIEAMLYRANQIGILGYKPYNNLGRQMQAKGWLNQEPLDDTIKAKNPILLTSAIDLMIKENIVQSGNISETLSDIGIDIYEDEINVLLGLSSPKENNKTSKAKFNNKKNKVKK
ncbi:MAG: XRE family transcriptional regulator [Romboutsia sp.]